MRQRAFCLAASRPQPALERRGFGTSERPKAKGVLLLRVSLSLVTLGI